MSSFYDLRVIVLLLGLLIQNLILASATDEGKNGEASTELSWVELLWSRTNESGADSYSESSCTKEIEAYSAALENQETWARQMWDASTKMQSGILQGNYVDFGMYQQCIGIKGSHNNVTVQGKHCMVLFSHDSGILVSSVCLPSSCNQKKALETSNSSVIISVANNSLGVGLVPMSASCTEKGSKDFEVGEILIIAFFSAVGSFMIFCTICDLVKRCRPERISSNVAINNLTKFSLYTNALALFDTNVRPGTMPAINGIRFLSTCWIVGLHHRGTTIARPLLKSVDLSLWSMTWEGVWYLMSTFATDNFFMISGFFVSYLFFKKIRKNGEFNLPMMYIHRYIRLTPGVMVVGLFVGFLYHRIGSGPMWDAYSQIGTRSCSTNWWKNLFYIQNFLPYQDICLMQSWFLAADMQLYLVTPFILYPLHRWPKYGLCVWVAFFLASIVAPALVIWLNGITMTGLPAVESFDYYHVRAYTRASPYLIGVILGYEMATNKRQLGKLTVVLSWISTCVIMVLCYFAIRRLHNHDLAFNLTLETVCAAFLRPFWSIAMAWMMYACTHGHGGLLARFLSLSIFLPLSRISFGVYLLHFCVIIYRIGTTTIPGVVEEFEIFQDYLGTMILSILLSAVVNLFFETPVLILESILQHPHPKRDQSNAPRNINTEVGKGTQSSNGSQPRTEI